MSLQVWLPLNGNLNNQGLSNIIMNSNAITYTDGKLGKAATFSSSYIGITNTPLTGSINELSFSFWMKTSTPSNTMCIYNGRTTVGGAIALFAVNGTFRFDDNSQHSLNYTIPSNNWEHYCITRDNINIKLYVNGALKYTTTSSGAGCSTTATKATIGASSVNTTIGSGNTLTGQLNDFRIYDHCLSAKEVKEISKGLVLHYQLKGFGQPNLINKAELYTNSTKLTRTASKSDDYIHTSMTVNLAANTTYTISFYTTGAMPNQVELGLMFQNGYNYYKFMGGSYHYKISDSLYYHNEPFTVANTGSYTIRCDWNISGETHSFWNFKIEEGSKATPWCPNSADSLYSSLGYNSTTEPDCSGFNNNGTKSGSIISDSNSPRYNSCYKIGSTSTKIKLPALPYSAFGNSYTFSWWEYNTTTNNMPWGFSDGNRLNLYHTGNLCWNTGDSGNNPFKNSSGTVIPNTKLCDSKWHHCAIVGNGSTTILYIDGIETGKATTYKALTGTQIYISGWDTGTQYTFNGSKLSDFRIYATALSAADVLELYNVPIMIDKSGNMYSYEYQEV